MWSGTDAIISIMIIMVIMAIYDLRGLRGLILWVHSPDACFEEHVFNDISIRVV